MSCFPKGEDQMPLMLDASTGESPRVAACVSLPPRGSQWLVHKSLQYVAGGGVEFHPPLHMLVLRVLFYFTSLFQNLLPQFRFGKYLDWHSLITCQGLSILLTSTWNMSQFGPEELSASFVRTLHAGGSWRTV